MKSSHKFNSSRKQPIKDQKPTSIVVRLMTPFSIECTQCNGYISKFKKFNGKKTEMKEKYLNKIKMFQLTIKCPSCNNSISFRTDPATADYVMLSGGVRMSGVGKTSNAETSNDNNNNNDNGNEGDEVDDVLERLLREEKEEQEQEEAKQQLKQNGNGTSTGGNENKLEDLEDKLIKLQKEQEQDVELENLRKQVNLQNLVSQSDKSAHHMSELEDKQFDTEYQSMVSLNSDINKSNVGTTLQGSHVHTDINDNNDNDEVDKNSSSSSSSLNVSRIVKKKKKKKVITI